MTVRQQTLAIPDVAFELAALVFFDALVPELMQRRGETEASMRARHAIWV